MFLPVLLAWLRSDFGNFFNCLPVHVCANFDCMLQHFEMTHQGDHACRGLGRSSVRRLGLPLINLHCGGSAHRVSLWIGILKISTGRSRELRRIGKAREFQLPNRISILQNLTVGSYLQRVADCVCKD